MNATLLDGEKVILARDILAIDNEALLNEVKRRLAGLFDRKTSAGNTAQTDQTDEVLNAVCGKWIDPRDADTKIVSR